MPGILNDKLNEDKENDVSLDMAGAKGTAPISIKEGEFCLTIFAKTMRQPNFSMFNKWKKVWVAGFLRMKHRSIIPGQNRMNQLQNRPLHWVTAVAEFLNTFKNWLPFGKF
jgi:hypothetical protein